MVTRLDYYLQIQIVYATTEDAYQDIWSQRDLYDFSDYAKNSPFYNASNKKVPRKFKDECGGLPMGSFIGLRSKMYSYLMDNGKNNKTCKGVKKDVIKKIYHIATTKMYYLITNRYYIK